MQSIKPVVVLEKNKTGGVHGRSWHYCTAKGCTIGLYDSVLCRRAHVFIQVQGSKKRKWVPIGWWCPKCKRFYPDKA